MKYQLSCLVYCEHMGEKYKLLMDKANSPNIYERKLYIFVDNDWRLIYNYALFDELVNLMEE